MTVFGAPVAFEAVWFSYGEEEQRPALEGVNLTIREGEFVALVGANGSGKSTLSKMVNALLVPERGTVLTLGLDTASDDEDVIFEIRSQAGLVLQNPDSQIVASIVSDDVAFGPENLAVAHDEIVSRVGKALDAVKMNDFAMADPNNLSGGQKQRVCIAGLLAMKPRILILDEPGAMLDIRGRRGIRRVLSQLHDSGLTIILVTHFMEEAALAERVVVLDEGTVFLEGSPREVFSHGPDLRSLGLDVPFSVQLGFALRSHGLLLPTIVSPRELKEYLSSWYNQALRNKAFLSEIIAGSEEVVTYEGRGSQSEMPSGGADRSRAVFQTEDEHTESALHPEMSASSKLTESENSVPPGLWGDETSVSLKLSGNETTGSSRLARYKAPEPLELTENETKRPSGLTGNETVVALSNVSFSYSVSNTARIDAPVLEDISFSVKSGELLGIIGHTGSGKTTLLKILAGLLFASRGTVEVAGVKLARGTRHAALHARVGMVFQYPERQLFAPTVSEDIAFGPVNAGLDRQQVEQRVRSALAQMDLDYDEYATRSPFDLSGGEKRRVAIAGILAMDPQVLIFDEPTAGLDVKGQRAVRDLINSLQQKGKTIILTSHSLDAIAELSTTVIVLNKGKVAMLGSPQEVFCSEHQEELKRINLGLPQTAEFALDLKELGMPLPEGLFTVETLAEAIVRTLRGDYHGA